MDFRLGIGHGAWGMGHGHFPCLPCLPCLPTPLTSSLSH
ncbi:hypothetical protein GXM_05383 [Nostoc sphaeroides CCNUC1]|uniref:Uncharacterized protein n=1 Tax=Nostoc sphaeroides CCNUC1 TaxID=2653204 RepID=A0A5P8W5U7_9NOSO|nr:hypothetical protein GXM_05383 [Nostoc sphaeroides CCNUC1]